MDKGAHELTVRLTVNDRGIASSPIATDAHVRVTVSTATEKLLADPELPPQSNSIVIEGNKHGLIALAEQLLAIAHTNVEGYHQHFDSDVFAGFFESDGDWELIVGRNDKRAIRRAVSDRNP
jgi:hypothetical protein